MKVRENIPLVMMIDDDELILTVNKLKIENTGCVDQIVTFNSATKAINYLVNSNHWPDIILCDIHMPVMDGWQFIDRYNELLQRFNQQSMLCIHSDISGSMELDELEKRKSVEMFITKPLTIEKVELLIEHYHNKYSMPEYVHGVTKFVTT